MSTRIDVVAIARELAPGFAERAAACDQTDAFVAESYANLKKRKLFSSGVPLELGGGGATHRELCAMLREIAHGCASSALAFSMHTHLVATTVCRWKHGATVEALLRRIAAEELVLVSTGGSDFVDSSGTAEKVDGGYRINARKIFCSGAPAGQLLMTSAIAEDPQAGPTVLHFGVPFNANGVKVHDNWRTLGMRGTGSHDVTIEGVFVPEASIGVRRPRGKWHIFWDVVSTVAWPLVYSAYLGAAEAARPIALRQAARRRDDPTVQQLVGEMDAQYAAARLAVEAMIALANDYDFEPALDRTREAYLYKGLATRGVLGAMERALEVCGGSSYFRANGIERLFRDVQGARFHPWPEHKQHAFAGRIALGVDPV